MRIEGEMVAGPDRHALRGIDCRPRQRLDVGFHAHADGAVLSRGGATFDLDRFGVDVWSQCDGETGFDQIIEALLSRHPLVESHCRVDAFVLLHRLAAMGFVEAAGLVDLSGDRCELDLRRIKLFVINCSDRPDRRRFMESQLRRLGLEAEFVPAVMAKPAAIGIGLSHLKILTREDLSPPFAILEDDCEFNQSFRDKFLIPVDTDALYLGVSHFGSRRPGELSRTRWRNVRWVSVDRHLLRVFNMYSTHAIVCMSERFQRNAARAAIGGLLRAGPGPCFPIDASFAALHAAHLVLTPRTPVCRQCEALGGAQGATELPLEHVWPDPAEAATRLGYGPALDD